jgi:hypothetical protein
MEIVDCIILASEYLNCWKNLHNNLSQNCKKSNGIKPHDIENTVNKAP